MRALLEQAARDTAAAVGLDRWWSHRRLSRGQCRGCRRVLRDDAAPGYCTADCAEEDQLTRAW